MSFSSPAPRRPPGRTHQPRRTAVTVAVRRLAVLALLWVAALSTAQADDERLRGLPFVRSYPFDEIGNVPRSLRLGFDHLGRVAVMYDGIYTVLNDSAWVERIDPASDSKVRMTRILVANGTYFYGGRGSWGTIAQTPAGRMRAVPLISPEAPAWTSVTPFTKLLATATAVHFYELNGVVSWSFATRRNTYHEMPRLTEAFTVGERLFASCQDRRLREFWAEPGEPRVLEDTGLEGRIVEYSIALDDAHALLALDDGHLFVFDGRTAQPWRPQVELSLYGKITALERLPGGGVAVAIANRGVYLFNAAGALDWALPLPEFHRVASMAANEPGVLWIAGENAIHRVYFHTPLTGFGQSLGLTANWPQVTRWNDNTLVCSNGTLYQIDTRAPGAPPHCRIMADKPSRQSDFMAAHGDRLLVGNPTGVFAVETDGSFTPVCRIENVAGMRFIRPNVCLVIGSREIAALEWRDGAWVECAARIEGVGHAPIHLEQGAALWVEMGADRVGRLSLDDGALHLRPIALPWQGGQWSNVGLLGDRVVLTGAPGQRVFYDEKTGGLVEDPALTRLLARSPYWILRLTRDASGVIWATHAQGVVTFTPRDGDYAVDAETFELRNDSYPTVFAVPDGHIWIAAARSLYHVEPRVPPRAGNPQPALVSLVSDHQQLELLERARSAAGALHFRYDDNSLSFRFFSGTYAWRSPPAYEYRIAPAEPWTPIDAGMVLRLPKLRDGAYRLEVQRAGPHDTGAAAFALPFVIRPPWYRTPLSYGVVAGVLLLSLLGAARWINRRSLRRTAELEEVVRERTQELERTMERLGEETRNAATLAERSRLAGEIHDSVQQGLSGAILHLDTTIAHPSIPPEVSEKLAVTRGMLSYSREEVQQAVWNLESPLLQDSSLGEALQKLAGYIRTGTVSIDVQADAEPISLGAPIQHNLLRIAQEGLTNAVKHARAQRIRVALRNSAECVQLVVHDDGLGFDPVADVAAAGHFGLRGLRARAKAIGAQLQIRSAPGNGTTIEVSVPHPPKPSHDNPRQE